MPWIGLGSLLSWLALASAFTSSLLSGHSGFLIANNIISCNSKTIIISREGSVAKGDAMKGTRQREIKSLSIGHCWRNYGNQRSLYCLTTVICQNKFARGMWSTIYAKAKKNCLPKDYINKSSYIHYPSRESNVSQLVLEFKRVVSNLKVIFIFNPSLRTNIFRKQLLEGDLVNPMQWHFWFWSHKIECFLIKDFHV